MFRQRGADEQTAVRLVACKINWQSVLFLGYGDGR
jgi:hypothetical protein